MLRVSSLSVVLGTSHWVLGFVPVWHSSLDQRCVGHLKKRDDTNRLPHFLNCKHQFLPHHTTGSTELKCLISEMSVMHTLGAIPGTGANPGCGVQWWTWSYAGCRLDSRLKLSYWFSLWSFKYPRTLCFEGTSLLMPVCDSGKKCAGVTLNPTGYLSVLFHPVTWDHLSPQRFDSVYPRGAVEGPFIDCYIEK